MKRSYKSALRIVGVSVMLSSYLYAAWLATYHHCPTDRHHNHVPSCSAEVEGDPCHHQARDGKPMAGGDHNAQIIASHHSCGLCDALMMRHEHCQVNADDLPTQLTLSVAQFCEKSTLRRSVNLPTKSRAPPLKTRT